MEYLTSMGNTWGHLFRVTPWGESHRVAGAAIARKLLAVRFRVTVVAWVSKVGRLVVECDPERVTRDAVDVTPVRCPDVAVAARMIEAVEAARKDGDSLGGVVSCAVR